MLLLSLNRKKSILKFLGMLSVSSMLYSLQLGDGSDSNRFAPVKILSNIQSVAGGLSHSLIIDRGNKLWSVGSNEYGQLGDNTNQDRNSPVCIMDDVVQVSAGDYYSMALKKNGELWVFGSIPDNIIEPKNKYQPKRIQFKTVRKPILFDTGVIDISAGPDYALYLKKDKKLWGFGNNENGVLGTGDFLPIIKPVMIKNKIQRIYSGKIYSLIIDTQNNLLITGNVYPETVRGVSGPINQFVKMASNVYFMTDGLYVTNDDELWGFGFAGYGNLGLENVTDIIPPTLIKKNVKKAVSSGSHTLVLLSNGDVFSCGGGPNLFGELGTGDNKPYSVLTKIFSNGIDISVGRYHSFILSQDGTLWGFGLNSYTGLM